MASIPFSSIHHLLSLRNVKKDGSESRDWYEFTTPNAEMNSKSWLPHLLRFITFTISDIRVSLMKCAGDFFIYPLLPSQRNTSWLCLG